MPKKQKSKQYGLTLTEQHYIHDHSKIIQLHNYLIQNYIVTQVMARLSVDPDKHGVQLSDDLRSVIVMPVEDEEQKNPETD